MTYGKTATLSRASSYQRGRNVVSIQSSRKGFGPIANIAVIVLILCLLGLVYLTQVTKTNALGYKVSELKNTQLELKEEQESLELEAVRLQNIDRVKNSDVAKGMQNAKPTALATQ